MRFGVGSSLTYPDEERVIGFEIVYSLSPLLQLLVAVSPYRTICQPFDRTDAASAASFIAASLVVTKPQC